MSVENLQVKIHKNKITWNIKKMYMAYFACPLGDQDKAWGPQKIRNKCYYGFYHWLNQRFPSMPFTFPMIWRKQMDPSRIAYLPCENKGFFSKVTSSS